MSRSVEIANIIQKHNPNLLLYWTPERNAIGYFNYTLGRPQVLVAELIDGSWAEMPELLVNGQPAIDPGSWVPVAWEDLRP